MKTLREYLGFGSGSVGHVKLQADEVTVSIKHGSTESVSEVWTVRFVFGKNILQQAGLTNTSGVAVLTDDGRNIFITPDKDGIHLSVHSRKYGSGNLIQSFSLKGLAEHTDDILESMDADSVEDFQNDQIEATVVTATVRRGQIQLTLTRRLSVKLKEILEVKTALGK